MPALCVLSEAEICGAHFPSQEVCPSYLEKVMQAF